MRFLPHRYLTREKYIKTNQINIKLPHKSKPSKKVIFCEAKRKAFKEVCVCMCVCVYIYIEREREEISKSY